MVEKNNRTQANCMNKQGLRKRTISLFTTILIASVAFGLFYTYQKISEPSGNVAISLPVVSDPDTIPGKKTKQQEADNNAALKAIASGDAYFAAKDYLNAKAAYQLAIDLSPDNQGAKEKLRKTMDLLRAQKAQNILFDVAIAGADKLFQAGDYEKAQIEYENAGKMLPGDPYPKNKINEIIKIQIDKKVKDDEYAKAIASADKFYTTNNLQLALLDYKKAVNIKSDQKYPQTRIKEITDLLAAQKAKDDAYNKAIFIADQQFKEIRYPDAIKSYKDALAVKPEQIYPKNKIAEIEGLMSRIKKAQDDYDKFIALADSFYIDKKYFKARENYLTASSVKPSESYPKEMISKADKMLTGQEAAMAKALEEQYAKAIADADKLMNDKSFEPARAEYAKASNLKPGEQYPKDKIQAIDDLLASNLKNKDERYKIAIANGDKSLANKVYEVAKNEFQNALTIKPGESYPKSKIAEIDKLIALDVLRKAEDTRYTKAIARGDSLFFEKIYNPAKIEFQTALKMKPTEAYPKNRIAEIDAALADVEKQKTKEAQYFALIAKADKGFNDKIYQVSRDDYSKASVLKPTENYPKEKIAEIDRISGDLAAVRKLDNDYKAAIAKADQLLAAKTYNDARLEYENALKIKAAEQYPQTKIAEIEKILADIAAKQSLEENYKTTIARADQLLASKTYEQAKSEYGKAQGLKPAEQYPKIKMAEIDGVFAEIARLKALEDDYSKTITGADKFFAEKSWGEAKDQYQNALKIKPAESYPKEKIGEIDKILADIAAKKGMDDKYSAAIVKADNLLAQKTYGAAKSEYANASGLKPDESYPKAKIVEIDKIFADIAAAKVLDDNYKAAIGKADQLLAAKTYNDARLEYENALKIKAAEQYPQTKIAEIEKILADIAAKQSLEENYKTTIARADQLLASKTYEQAKSEYGKALGLKPAEQYPKTKMAEIDGILAEIARLKALDDEYSKAITEADKFFTEKSWGEAKGQYQNALKIKPAESYPKEKIGEIDKVLADIAAKKSMDDKYSAAILKADNLLAQKTYSTAKSEYTNASVIKPDESYPKTKIAEIDKILADIAAAKVLDDNYKAAIAKADQLLAAKTYNDARLEYENALKIKASEQYPQTKIAEIDKILADIAAKQSLEENYKATIARADQLFASKNYDQAKSEYGKALGLKSAEQYPKTKMAEIDGILAEIARLKALDEEYANVIAQADKLLSGKTYSDAKVKFQEALKLKPAEKYPLEKIAEADKALAEQTRLKAIDDQYSAAILKADNLLTQKTYPAARVEYVNASAIKPGENYPKEKISEIDKILADIAAAKIFDDNYRSSITRADQLLAAKTYAEARTEYEKAQKLKPADQYPPLKIAEIDKILADREAIRVLNENYQTAIKLADQALVAKTYNEAKVQYEKALGIKPEEQYPKTKVAEIEAIFAEIVRKKAIDDEYSATITSADQLLAQKSYDPAKSKYQKAAELKPAEQYPKTKLAEIEKALTDVARLKAIDDQYKSAVAEADQLFQSKTYIKAKESYNNAGKIKPAEQYPKDKITEIDGIFAAVAKQKALDDQYLATVAKADQLLASKSWDQAKTEFTSATTLKPGEQYPKDKIKELDGILAEIKAKEDAYKSSVANADMLLSQKKYEEARTEYQNALAIKSQATYPKEKIAEINKTLEELLGKQKYYDNLIGDADKLFTDKDYPKAKDSYQRAAGVFPDQTYPKNRIAVITAKIDSLYRANKSVYDKAVADGDRFYNSFEFDKAIDAYSEAANYLPMESYPRDMILKIRRTIAENAIADVLKSSVVVTSNNEKQFSFTPVNIASRKNNFVYIKIKNISGKPFNVLLRYGKDKQSNGGVVMRNLSIDGKVNERLVSVKDQDLWSREDNNWISIIPQGGDVEVSFIQVSRAKLE